MHTLKLTQIGNSVGVILPKEDLARLKLGKGRIGVSNRNAGRHALTPTTPTRRRNQRRARDHAGAPRRSHQLAK